jgi:hypothetical protein
VHLLYIVNNKVIQHRKLPNKTGNSILIPINNNLVSLIFSKFTDTNERSIDRWKYCNNYQAIFDSEKLLIKASKLDLETGYLVRCAPIKVHNRWYLPIYRELNPYGLIMSSEDGQNWTPSGKIGLEMDIITRHFGKGVLIQPTIWYDKTFHSLSRDITNNHKAWYSRTITNSPVNMVWSEPISSNICNYNNSLIAIPDAKLPSLPFIVWNNGPNREILMLGKLNEDLSVKPIYRLNKQRASYPNYCIDENQNIYIVHTDGPIIRMHCATREQWYNI